MAHISSSSYLVSPARYPNHSERKRIETEHKEELTKLHTPDGDYYHGLNSGCLAAARLFAQQADVLHVNEHKEVTDELLATIASHHTKMEEAKQEFPQIDVDHAL